MISDKNGYDLIRLSRLSILSFFAESKIEFDMSYKDLFHVKQGVFVTLYKQGRLRGCVGQIYPLETLDLLVQKLAISSAFKDPRFKPLSIDEVEHIKIEISILSTPVLLHDISMITLGSHGLVLVHKEGKAIFLPQVPIECNWSLDEFLIQLSLKAGLSEDGWLSSELYYFSTQVFSES